ncbi:MBL fold metallo-hydrolase [Brevundimonas lutea]|uniref:MBL fold metallo-hydrolase n=1 Tax=Brevundimonas lutea TaxID=2293980 RepID=UPI000F03D646|nr:MBL fold metallo-hydrolase [Brevundimonas lutea]
MIPFVREFDFEYGRVDRVSPRLRRVICNNPGPFTFTGTATFIVGDDEVAVIDPGPIDEAHLTALMEALKDERVTHILLTHTHADHSPLAKALQQRTGAPILAAPPPARPTSASANEGNGGEGWDETAVFPPDRVLSDGETINGPDWSLTVMATPGHASNHLAFVLPQENALLVGDHVMGWSTSVVVPPDGSMADYMRSLDRVIAGDFSVLWPTHGPPVVHPAAFLEAYKAHRLDRERQILERLAAGDTTIPQMVAAMYVGLDPRLVPAAGQSVLAHLIKLVEDGRVTATPAPTVDAKWRLT